MFLTPATREKIASLGRELAQLRATALPERYKDHFFICVNAANTDKDFEWMVQHNSFDAKVRNVSSDYSQLALQGPRAAAILAKATNADLGKIRYYWFRRATCCGIEGLLARTGYTGEDGFEFYFPPAESELPAPRTPIRLLRPGESERLRSIRPGNRASS